MLQKWICNIFCNIFTEMQHFSFCNLNYILKFKVFCALKNGVWSEFVSIILKLNNFFGLVVPEKKCANEWIHKLKRSD